MSFPLQSDSCRCACVWEREGIGRRERGERGLGKGRGKGESRERQKKKGERKIKMSGKEGGIHTGDLYTSEAFGSTSWLLKILTNTKNRFHT